MPDSWRSEKRVGLAYSDSANAALKQNGLSLFQGWNSPVSPMNCESQVSPESTKI
jgi:hypothetical protein